MPNIRILPHIFIVLLLFSCSNQGDECFIEKKIYQGTWNETIVELGRDNNYKATYFILTNKQKIYISGIKEVIMYGQKGDSIVKPKNSFLVDVYRNGKIEFTSRLISATCDTIVDKNYKFKTYKELKEEHPLLYNWR